MIHELVTPKFIGNRLADLARRLDDHARELSNASAAVRENAEREGVTAEDLRSAANEIRDSQA